MALATRCPSCTTVFRISTSQAAAKGGMVRCGVCRNVFNSLDALVRVEDLDVVEEVIVASAEEKTAASTATEVSAHEVPSEASTPVPIEADAIAVEHEAGRLEPSFAATGRTTISEWWMPDTKTEQVPSSGPTTSGERGRLTGTAEASLSLPSERRDTSRPEPSAVDGTNPIFMRPEPEVEPASRALRWTFGVLALIAAVALLAQVSYLWRDELSVRWSPARPWLAAACGMIGCKVGYPVHAEAITIESATVQTTGPNSNVYVVSALLRNRDAVDVRYPTIELVLTDLQDQPILRRDLRPEDYLAGVAGRSPTAGFAAQSELPIRITFELNNLRFAGYRLNQFYP